MMSRTFSTRRELRLYARRRFPRIRCCRYESTRDTDAETESTFSSGLPPAAVGGGSASLHPRREDQDVALEFINASSTHPFTFVKTVKLQDLTSNETRGESGMRRLKCEHLFLFNAPSREYLDAVLKSLFPADLRLIPLLS